MENDGKVEFTLLELGENKKQQGMFLVINLPKLLITNIIDANIFLYFNCILFKGFAITYASPLSNAFLGVPLEVGKCNSCGTFEPGQCKGKL